MAANYIGKTGTLYIITKIKSILDKGYIAKDGEKILSTNDFTDEYKQILDEIATETTKIIVDSVLNNTSENAIQNKAVFDALSKKAALADPAFTGIPTAPTAEAGTNSTQIATTAFVVAAITEALSGVTGIDYQVVVTLPESGEKGIIYLVKKENSSNDNHDEYIWVNEAWEYIGTTSVDLTGYIKETDLIEIPTSEIDAIFDTVFGTSE